MAADSHSDRTRAILCLPLGSDSHVRALQSILTHLRKQRTNKQLPVLGYNYSSFFPPAFHGAWWNERRGEWDIEDNLILTIDYPARPEETRTAQALKNLKAAIARIYRKCGVEQEEIWVAVHLVRLL